MSTVRLAYNPGPINAYAALDRPSVRLAYHPEGDRTLSDSSPSVRQAYGNSPPERNGTSGLEGPSVRLPVAPNSESNGANSVEHHVNEGGLGQQCEPPSARLALGGSHSQDKQMAMSDPTTLPALLVSYVYLEPFLKNRHRYHYRDWVLDSGAFSAHQSGTEIILQDYIGCCRKLLIEDQTMVEVYALDVIGDHVASRQNCEEMWRQGVQAIPCFHVGSPEAELRAIARDYPKIALGGCVGFKGKDKWAAQCFARVWPKAIHGFGFGGEKSIMALPWHSVDATNWEIGPCKYGRWNSFGQMSVRGSKQNLRSEVEWYLRLERRARAKWKKEMELLGTLDATDRPTDRT